MFYVLLTFMLSLSSFTYGDSGDCLRHGLTSSSKRTSAEVGTTPKHDHEKVLTAHHDESFLFLDRVKDGKNDLGLTPVQFKAAQLNAKEMEGITRGDGVPYATHPLKLSMLSQTILGNQNPLAQRTLLYTLTHDILEEGRGLNPKAYKQLLEEFPESPLGVRAAMTLTEPDFSALDKAEGIRDSMIEVIAYTRKIKHYYKESGDQALYNASAIDKLFNVFDRYNAVKRGKITEENHAFLMKWRLAKQGYILRQMPETHPYIRAFAEEFAEKVRKEIGASKEEIEELMSYYSALDKQYGDALDEIILKEKASFGF